MTLGDWFYYAAIIGIACLLQWLLGEGVTARDVMGMVPVAAMVTIIRAVRQVRQS